MADRGSVRLRNLQAAVVEGSDAATLETALNTFFQDDSRGDTVLIEMYRVADYKVLVVYAD